MKIYISSMILFLALAVPFVAARAACTGPTGDGGQVFYNADYKSIQYCDGTEWRSVGKSSSCRENLALEVMNNNPGVYYSTDTGNFYRYVGVSYNHGTSRDLALSTPLNGALGHLVIITSSAENSFVRGLISGSDAWIGASDSTSEGDWLWLDGPEGGQQFWLGNGSGSAQNGFYTNWQTTPFQEPNDMGGEDCGAIYSADGTWNDHGCASPRGYIIEWEGNDVIAPSGPIAAILNSNPGVYYNTTTGNFYKLSAGSTDYASATTGAAATMLNGIAGYLATITSAAEQTTITLLAGGVEAWIGADDIAVEGEWRWVTGGAENGQQFWQGTSGGSAQNGFYTNWNGGEPNDSGGEDCGQIGGSSNWNDRGCGTSLRYIIEWNGTDVLD